MATETIDSKLTSELLQLPLIIVRGILERVVHDYTRHHCADLLSILRLRRVNNFFDAELTHLLGRDLKTWGQKAQQTCMFKASRPFVIGLLRAHIGDYDGGKCEFVAEMHGVIDILMQQFELVGEARERHEVLNAVCYALAIRPFQKELIVNRTWRWKPYKPPAVDPVPAAFAVALSNRYTDVVNSMLDRYPIVFSYTEKGIREEHKLLSVSGWDFNVPLDVAIGLGHTEQAKLLLSHGANVGMCQFFEWAAQQGFSEMIDLILGHMPWGLDDRALHRAGRIVRRAAAHQQWRIVRHILDRDSVSVTHSTMRVYLDNVLCSAARYGRNDLVTEMLDLCDRKFSKRPFPLSEAAAGGQLSTCKLLLERNARPEPKEMVGRAEVLARSVARGGSVEVCELLRQHNFWKPWHEIHFLPIAAEYGHLEFAKYAVKHGCDRNRRPAKETSITVLEEDRVLKSPDDIRYFALLRAVVSGHQHIVRWLADEVGMDVGRDSELAHPELFPINLAIAASNDGMLALLLQMEANSELEPYTEQCVPCQKRAVETLELYRAALSLREDFNAKWRWIS